MILLIIAGVVAAILLVHLLEGAFKAAALVLLGCIMFVFACDFFNVDWHPLVARQAHIAKAEARAHARELRDLMN